MAHLDHDALVGAFMRVDPRVVTCERGGDQGYTHVHGPSQAPGIDQCRTHWIVIEKINGTRSRPYAAWRSGLTDASTGSIEGPG